MCLERNFAEEFLREQKTKERGEIDAQLKWNNKRLENMEQKLYEVNDKRTKETHEVTNEFFFVSLSKYILYMVK